MFDRLDVVRPRFASRRIVWLCRVERFGRRLPGRDGRRVLAERIVRRERCHGVGRNRRRRWR